MLARLKKIAEYGFCAPLGFTQAVIVRMLEFRFSAGMEMFALVPLKPAALPVAGVAPGRPRTTLLQRPSKLSIESSAVVPPVSSNFHSAIGGGRLAAVPATVTLSKVEVLSWL